MRLTVLGSGSCELKVDRSSPAYLVESGPTKLLLDMGQGALRRLMEAGSEPVELDGVLLSHHHLDHFADVLPLLFALNYDPTMSVGGQIVLAGDRSMERVFGGLGEVFGEWVQPPDSVLTRRYVDPGDSFAIGGLMVSCERADHMESSLAYRLEAGGKSLVYCGDSAATDRLVDFAGGADLLICHTVGTIEEHGSNHMHPAAAGAVAAKAGVGTLIMSHIYRRQPLGTSLDEAASAFSGKVLVAEDLMILEV